MAWGSRRGEHLCALPAAIAIPEPRSVFPRLGAGGQRARASGRCCPRVIPPTPVPTPTPQGLSLVPCPQDSGPSLTKEPAHAGEQTQVVYSSFLSCHPAVSPHLHANKTQRNREPEPVSGGAVGAARAPPSVRSEHSLSVRPLSRGWEPAWDHP